MHRQALDGLESLRIEARFYEREAEVLRQRPDLAAAERSMAAANAAIGAAEADRYPRLNLVGNITPTRLIMNSGPAVSVTTWSITSSLLAPLIDGGRCVLESGHQARAGGHAVR